MTRGSAGHWRFDFWRLWVARRPGSHYARRSVSVVLNVAGREFCLGLFTGRGDRL